MKNRFLIVLYFVAVILYLVFLRATPEIFYLALITKGLVMPILLVFFLLNLKIKFKKSSYLIVLSLFFACIGDISLYISKKTEFFFLIGMAGFFLTHLLYIFIFLDKPKKYSLIRKKWYLIIPFFIYGISIFALTYSNLGDLMIPIIIYTIVIITMTVFALNLYKNVDKQSFNLIFWGAISFLISDTFIAINLFKYEIPIADELTMPLYALGQFMIVLGYLRYVNP